MSEYNLTIKKTCGAILCFFLALPLLAFSPKIEAKITPIKALKKQEVIEYFFILNQKNNHDVNFGFEKDVSQFNIEENEAAGATFTTDAGDNFQLYKIALDNSGRLFYVLTYQYIGNFYSGESDILAVHEITAENKLKRMENFELANAQSSTYTNINGFAYCEDKVCAHFSIRPFARWNATEECSTYPFELVDDWVIWEGDKTKIYNREISRIICVGGETTLSEEHLKRNVAQQIRQGSLTYSNLNETIDHEILISAISKTKNTSAVQQLNMTDLSLSESDLMQLSKWLKSNGNLQELNLSYNGLNSKGAKEIASIIRNSPNLSTLNLSGNTFNGPALKLLAGAIRDAKHLKSLNLSDSLFDAESINTIIKAINKNTSIEEVNLSTTGFNLHEWFGVKSLQENRHIKKLILNHNDIG